MLDGQSGIGKSGVAVRHRSGGKTFGAGRDKPPMDDLTYGDSGGASRFFYCAKASRSERNEGLWQTKVQATHRYGAGIGEGKDPDAPTFNRNHHPTVKPVALMRWLVRLVARPGDTILDPFTGSGTTGVACIEEGREFVGIERELDYVEISRRRLEAASAQLAIPLPTQDSPSVLRANDTCDTGSQDSLWRETASSDRG